MVVDTAMGDLAIRNGILEGLAALGSDYAMYGQSNVAVVGTHQHSGPGACKFPGYCFLLNCGRWQAWPEHYASQS